MTFYAKCDPSAAWPAPVTNYYDTDFDPYEGTDFTAPGFIELTADQWATRSWDSKITGGKLIPPT